MSKKVFLSLLTIILIFPFFVSAKKVSKDDVESRTYIIGKYMFTREKNDKYDGKLTTPRIMLASKSIESNKETDMLIYYKKVDGTWVNGLTGKEINVPSEFEIEVTDLDKELNIISPSNHSINYSKNDVETRTYIIGKYMFTRETNSKYDGKLTTPRIMLASKSIESNKETDMLIYYKKADGTWVNALTNKEISIPNSFSISYIDLEKQDSNNITVYDITGGTNLKATTQNLTLKCSDTVGVTGYYFGTTEPTSASAVSTTTSADLKSLAGSGLTKSVKSAGTYWLACKNKDGEYAKKSIKIVNYKINNLFEKIEGITGSYTSSNYTSESTGTYVVKSGTSLTLASIYTIPTGSNASNFKGYSTSYGTNASTLSTSAPTVASGMTYYMWFNRITYKVTVSKPTNGTVNAETVTKAGNNVTANSASATLTVKYGDTVKSTATANTGYSFDSWSGGYVSGTTNPIVGDIVTSSKTIEATFIKNAINFSDTKLNSGTYGTAYTSNPFGAAGNGTGSYTYSIKSGAPTGATIDSSKRTISFTNTTPAGNYNVVVTAKDNNSNVIKDATMKITINKASSTASLNPTSGTLTYGTNATSTITKKTDGTLSCTSSDTSVATCSVSGTKLTITPVANAADGKTATITLKNTAGTNYAANDSLATYTATVNRKTLTCPSSPSAKTYNGSAQASGITCPSGSTAGGDTKKTNAGTYAQTCTANSGYKFASTCSVSWVINARTVSITAPTANSSTLTYSGSAQNLLATAGSCSTGGTMYWYSSNPTTSSTAPTFSTSSGWTTTAPSSTSYKGTNAGTYYMWYYCYVSDTTNNTGTGINTVKNISKAINKASSTASLNPTSGTLTYGTNATSTITKETDGTLSCKSSDTSVATCSVSGTKLTITPVANAADGKKATITLKNTAGTNYAANNSLATYTATVNRKTLTCPSSPSAKTYNGSAQNSGITCPSGSTAGGDTKKTNAGTYAQTCTANSGYKFASTCSVSWTINKKSVTITAKNQTIEYGTTISKTTSDVSVSTLASGDSLTAITLTQSTTNITTNGAITPSAAIIKKGSTAVTSNYLITYVTGKLIINPKETLTVNLTYNNDNGTSYTKSKAPILNILDSSSSGLKGGTYQFKYTWSTSNLTSCAQINENYVLSIPIEGGTTSKMWGINNDFNSNGAGKFYICNIDEIKSSSGESIKANTLTSIEMYLDNENATASFTPNGGAISLNESVTITLNDLSGIKSARYVLFDSNLNLLEDKDSGWTTTSTYQMVFTEVGTYYIGVSVLDNAGNLTNDWIKSYTFDIQSTAADKVLSVIYDANGGSGVMSNTSCTLASGKSTCKVKISENGFGYDHTKGTYFNGWIDENYYGIDNYKKAKYAPGEEIEISSNVILKADWLQPLNDEWEQLGGDLISGMYNAYQPEVIYIGDKPTIYNTINNGTSGYNYLMYFFGWACSDRNDKTASCPNGYDNSIVLRGADSIYLARAKTLDGTWEVYSNNGSKDYWGSATESKYWKIILGTTFGSEYDEWHVGDPSIVYKDGKLYMAYSACGLLTTKVSGNDYKGPSAIGGASSEDGIIWTKYGQNASWSMNDANSNTTATKGQPTPIVAWNNELNYWNNQYSGTFLGGYQRPHLIYEDNKWKMWFDYDNNKIGYAENASTTPLTNSNWNVNTNNGKIQMNPYYYHRGGYNNGVDISFKKIGNIYYGFGDPFINWLSYDESKVYYDPSIHNPNYNYKNSDGTYNTGWSGRQIVEYISTDGFNWTPIGYFMPDDGYDASQIPQVYYDEPNNKLCVFYAGQKGTYLFPNRDNYMFKFGPIKAKCKVINH